MNTLNIHRVVEVSLVTRKHGDFNVHNLITLDEYALKPKLAFTQMMVRK